MTMFSRWRIPRLARFGRTCGLALMAGALCAQEGYNPADIQAGKHLYGVNCSACHGPNGDFVSGVDLGHGKFRTSFHGQ